jgi:hypothetical protein
MMPGIKPPNTNDPQASAGGDNSREHDRHRKQDQRSQKPVISAWLNR